MTDLTEYAEAVARNAATVADALRLISRHRPETLEHTFRELRALDRATTRAQRAAEAALEAAAWAEAFLIDHPELRSRVT